MDKFKNELIIELLETLKIPVKPSNIATIKDEIENISNANLRKFYREAVSVKTYGNGMAVILKTAKKYKKDILEGTEQKAKEMYKKFYAQQSAMTDYTQTHRNEVPNDRDWFKSIDYSKLINTDGRQTYTKQELYVLNELGGGEFLLDLRFTLDCSKIIDKIKKIIDKVIVTKYLNAESIESKRVAKMLSQKVA